MIQRYFKVKATSRSGASRIEILDSNNVLFWTQHDGELCREYLDPLEMNHLVIYSKVHNSQNQDWKEIYIRHFQTREKEREDYKFILLKNRISLASKKSLALWRRCKLMQVAFAFGLKKRRTFSLGGNVELPRKSLSVTYSILVM